MGTTVLYQKPANIKEYLSKMFEGTGEFHSISPNKLIHEQHVLKSAIKNYSEFYCAIERKVFDEVSKELLETYVFAGFIKFQCLRTGEFSYKVMDEFYGPYGRQCPSSILKMLSPLDTIKFMHKDSIECAKNWRKDCEKFASIKNLKNGEEISFDQPIKFTDGSLLRKFIVQKNKNSLRFRSIENSKLYRIRKAYLADHLSQVA